MAKIMMTEDTVRKIAKFAGIKAGSVSKVFEVGREYELAEVAKKLYGWNDFNLSKTETACVLTDMLVGLGYKAEDVARILNDKDNLGIDISVGSIAYALKEELDLPIEEVVRIIHSKDGLGLPIEEVAEAIEDAKER